MNIKVGDKLPYFDNGVITDNNMEIVTITKVTPFDEMNTATIVRWKHEVNEFPYLYNKNTDYFIEAIVEELDETLLFVRTSNGEWFSFDNQIWDGRLDYNGTLTEKLQKT